MKFFIIMMLFFFICSPVHAEEWISSTEKKYMARNPELFEDLQIARNLLNSWSGNSRSLSNAKSILNKIIEEDARFAPAYMELGKWRMRDGYINEGSYEKGSLKQAYQYVLKSLEIEPEYAEAYVLIGQIYISLYKSEDLVNALDAAKKALTKAEKIGIEHPVLDAAWVSFYHTTKDYIQAIKLIKNMENGSPTDQKASLGMSGTMAHMYAEMGEYDLANDYHQKHIKHDPDLAWAWGNYSSFLLFQYYKVDESIFAGREALKRMDYGMARYVLGCALYTKWAFLKQKPETQDEAEKYFDEAQEIFPDIKTVINRTKRSLFTRITATELMKLIQKPAK